MGSNLMKRPPKYVQGFIDRHGKARFYFRRAGFKTVALPGLPWSPEFMAAYEVALGGQSAPIASERVTIGLPQHHRSVLQGKGQGWPRARRQARGHDAARAHREADGGARR
jgi:hypothetical protein